MPNNHLPTWALVADNCQAKIYRVVKFPKLEEVSVLKHPESRLHDQELVSSKPGRGFQSMGVTRHAYSQETDPKQMEAIHFAQEVTAFLLTAYNGKQFERLYIIAEPAFLGLLRQHLNPQVKKAVVREEPKSLVTHPISTIEQHLSEL